MEKEYRRMLLFVWSNICTTIPTLIRSQLKPTIMANEQDDKKPAAKETTQVVYSQIRKPLIQLILRIICRDQFHLW